MKIWCMWVSKNSVNELMGPATQKQGILIITQDLGKIDKISSSQKQDPTMILQLMMKAYRHLVVAGRWSGLCIKPDCWCHSIKTTCCLSCQDLWIFFDHSIHFTVVVSRKVLENYVFGIFSSLYWGRSCEISPTALTSSRISNIRNVTEHLLATP